MDIEDKIYGKGVTLDNYCASNGTKPKDYNLRSIGLVESSELFCRLIGGEEESASDQFFEEIPENAEAVIGYDSQIVVQTLSLADIPNAEPCTSFYRMERGDVLIPKKNKS